MAKEEKQQKLDLFLLFEDAIKEGKRRWALLLVLVLVCAGGLTVYRQATYSPVYTASVSFSVRVANPLYASISSYNFEVAEQMAKTFPYILTSGVLQERVMDHLQISYMPPINVKVNASSSVLTVEVTDGDPKFAYDVLSTAILYYPDIAEFVVGPTVLVMLSDSGVPAEPVVGLELGNWAIKGAIVGAALWIAFVIVVLVFKNTVHNQEELKQVLNSPCLGQIPAVKLPRNVTCPMLGTRYSNSGFTESVRQMRMRMEKVMEEQEKKVLLVSSALPGEGKTMTSVNLAVSLAKKGKRVLLIDCDLRNPSVAKALNVSRSNSLAEYLNGNVALRDVLHTTDVENLYILSGGAGKKDPTRYLADPKMPRLIQSARQLFDYVILDTPPCSLLADAAELAELAECGLMVIRQDYASREQIIDGVQRLGDYGLPIVGCVLNGARRMNAGRYGFGYGYGYGYGYRYGYGSRSE